MTEVHGHFDVVVIGAGPAGQKAAVQAAKGGLKVLVVEREPKIGGECVHRGTIPSKTLRESAVFLAGLKRRTAGVLRKMQTTERWDRFTETAALHTSVVAPKLLTSVLRDLEHLAGRA